MKDYVLDLQTPALSTPPWTPSHGTCRLLTCGDKETGCSNFMSEEIALVFLFQGSANRDIVLGGMGLWLGQGQEEFSLLASPAPSSPSSSCRTNLRTRRALVVQCASKGGWNGGTVSSPDDFFPSPKLLGQNTFA